MEETVKFFAVIRQRPRKLDSFPTVRTVPGSWFMSRRKGFDTQALFEWFDQIRSQTEPAYQALLERMRQELRVNTVEPWDLEFYFSALTNEFE